jgi:hypothetical protein
MSGQSEFSFTMIPASGEPPPFASITAYSPNQLS